ncbi:hypothetical protein C8R46DRAFT_1190501 [Mycena filopes]|nr:hypothetical protein C8R46DRAFT_1190501 [Mycena filopes]
MDPGNRRALTRALHHDILTPTSIFRRTPECLDTHSILTAPFPGRRANMRSPACTSATSTFSYRHTYPFRAGFTAPQRAGPRISTCSTILRAAKATGLARVHEFSSASSQLYSGRGFGLTGGRLCLLLVQSIVQSREECELGLDRGPDWQRVTCFNGVILVIARFVSPTHSVIAVLAYLSRRIVPSLSISPLSSPLPPTTFTTMSDYNNNQESSNNYGGSNDNESGNNFNERSSGNESRNNEESYGGGRETSSNNNSNDNYGESRNNNESSFGGGGGARESSNNESSYGGNQSGNNNNESSYGGNQSGNSESYGSNNREERGSDNNNSGGGSFGRDNESSNTGSRETESSTRPPRDTAKEASSGGGGGMASYIEKGLEMAEEKSGHQLGDSTEKKISSGIAGAIGKYTNILDSSHKHNALVDKRTTDGEIVKPEKTSQK